MAMITCPECHKSVSSEALACPSCGYPLKPAVREKKTGLWWGLGCLLAIPAVMIVVAVVGLLAAIAIPSFMRARDTSRMHACLINLQAIQAAKAQAALAQAHRPGDAIPETELSAFLKKDFRSLNCPQGGRYIAHPVGEDPECSVHGKLSAVNRGGPMPPSGPGRHGGPERAPPPPEP